jgi:hypothetical protein
MVIRLNVYWCHDCFDYTILADEKYLNCIYCHGKKTENIGWIEDYMQQMPPDEES